jgi:hypothetical protein
MVPSPQELAIEGEVRLPEEVIVVEALIPVLQELEETLILAPQELVVEVVIPSPQELVVEVVIPSPQELVVEVVVPSPQELVVAPTSPELME